MTPAIPAWSGGPTNLAWIYQESLTCVVRLRSGRLQVTDSRHFRAQVRELLRGARDQALGRGYSEQAIKDAQLAIVALLDLTIVELGSPAFEGWSSAPLLEGESQPIADAFQRVVDRLMAQADSTALAETLEVFLLSMLLGYESVLNAPQKEGTPPLRDRMMERLTRIRGVAPDLSPAWRSPDEAPIRGSRASGGKRLLLTVVGGVLALALIFGGYKIAIGKNLSELISISRST